MGRRQWGFKPVPMNQDNVAFRARPMSVPKNSPGIVGNMWRSADNLQIDEEGEPERGF